MWRSPREKAAFARRIWVKLYWRFYLIQMKRKCESHSVVSNLLWPHGWQHARPPCPWPTPGVYSDSCPLSWWCHPTISSSVIPFSDESALTSGGQSIGVSVSASVLPMNIQDWFPLGWTGWISLPSKGLSRVLSFLYSSTLTSIHDHWKNHSLD